MKSTEIALKDLSGLLPLLTICLLTKPYENKLLFYFVFEICKSYMFVVLISKETVKFLITQENNFQCLVHIK